MNIVEQALRNAIDAINQCKAALSEIDKCEPVGWFLPNDYHGFQQVAKEHEGMDGSIPLYTSPQPRDWVGLSDEMLGEITRAWAIDIERTPRTLADTISDELKQLNTKG